ncbi:MAG TPA: hypothetical protein VLB32_02945 [Candidatus Acidoferrales bacterium]|nr:hypothetical protein [Candidatus Acidoferrales bacterium]
MPDVQCVHCGKAISDGSLQCPYCREDVAAHAVLRHRRGLGAAEQGARWIRRGLLCMLLAGISYTLLGGHSPIPITIPFEVAPWVMNYALPFLFIAGLGLAVFGFVRRSMG